MKFATDVESIAKLYASPRLIVTSTHANGLVFTTTIALESLSKLVIRGELDIEFKEESLPSHGHKANHSIVYQPALPDSIALTKAELECRKLSQPPEPNEE